MDGNPAADPEFNPDAVVRLPVQCWTFTMSDSKESRMATPAKSGSRTRSQLGFRSTPGSGSVSELAGHVSLSRFAEGRDPPPVYLNRSSPSGLWTRAAATPHMARQPPRRNDGAAAVKVKARSERIAVLMQSRSI
jgi:hypothetical protein